MGAVRCDTDDYGEEWDHEANGDWRAPTEEEWALIKDGECPWDTLFGNTGQGVIMQLDMGNALRGGADLIDILQRYPGRGGTVHLKPYCVEAGKDDPHAGFRPIIGEDSVPWADIFRICEATGGTEWYIVEYESDAYPPLEAVDRCLQALKAMGK